MLLLETGTNGADGTCGGGVLIDTPIVEDDEAKAVLAVLTVANEGGGGGGGGIILLLLIRSCSFVDSLLLTSCVDAVGAVVGMSAGDRLGGVGTSNILLAVISTLLDLGDSNGCVNDMVA